ncbi:MAG TPA: HEAT repeat domain-containing protein [Planctomycetota bacterium]|nr:HEAT repeat domain-containing protein [Planctomycetota bacterium]
MPEGVVTWSCPRCGRQNSAERELCLHCGAVPAPWPDPLKRCPDCSHEFDESAREGKVHCPKCGREFEDYEEWVRRCRAAAFAATRPLPPPPVEPPPRPPHLKQVAGSLLAMAAFTIASGVLVGRWEVLIPSVGLAILQIVAGLAVYQEWRHADGVVRFAAGLSALVPVFILPAIYFVGIFAFFSRPGVVLYFGGRVDPLQDRLRHPMIAWLVVSIGVVAALFAVVVSVALETAARWNDPLPPMLELGSGLSAFFVANRIWAPLGLLSGICVLALWGKVNRHGFLAVVVLSIVGVVAVGAPPIAAAWLYGRSARVAETYRHERDLQRLLWGAREQEPDPKVRIAALRGLAAVGRNAKVVVPSLLRAIKDPDRRIRLSAAAALAQFDPTVEDTLPILIAALEDDRSNEEEKDEAARALGSFGPRARPALPLLHERMKHGDAATLALVEIGPASIPGLTAGLQHEDAALRRRAARALRLQGPTARNAVPLLLERVKDPDPGVRVEAIAALGEIHRDKAIPVLRDLLRGDKADAKAAADALCALGQRDGLAELPQGSSSMNALRTPALWDHLSRSVLDRDLEGSGSEILGDLAERGGLCADLATECAELPVLTAFRRISASSRKRSVLDVLQSFDVEFVLESDRIRVLPREQARAIWQEWLAEQAKKRP